MDKLKEAAKLVAEVATTMNREFKVCECCDMKKYDNFAEAQTYIELQAIVRKLERFAATAEPRGTR